MVDSKVQGAQSFSRSIAVLNLIADAARPPAMAELVQQSDLTRPTLYRIVASLQAEDLVRQTPERRFVLGPQLIALAHRALAQNDIRPVAREALSTLRDETGETVHLAVFSQNAMIYIDKFESTQTVRMASEVGTRVPLHSTSVGRAYLAALPEDQCRELLEGLSLAAVTKRTSTTKTRLGKVITEAREVGYSYEEEENEPGIACFGAPIFDATGLPIAAVSVSVPVFRRQEESEFYCRPLRARCLEISALCGYQER